MERDGSRLGMGVWIGVKGLVVMRMDIAGR